MSGFVDTMRLKGMAEEDIYFARRDRELVEALRRRKAALQGDGKPQVRDPELQHPGAPDQPGK